jgi:hypothetical protein
MKYWLYMLSWARFIVRVRFWKIFRNCCLSSYYRCFHFYDLSALVQFGLFSWSFCQYGFWIIAFFIAENCLKLRLHWWITSDAVIFQRKVQWKWERREMRNKRNCFDFRCKEWVEQKQEVCCLECNDVGCPVENCGILWFWRHKVNVDIASIPFIFPHCHS